jgi:autotransporter translocation and assembly factor TamB
METNGSIDRLALNLTSSPTLRQEEILSLITTGNPKNSFTGNNTGKMGGQLFLDFQKNQILGGIKNSIQNAFKLDDLSYNTDVSPETNKRKSSLRVGKYLSDKLFVTYTLERTGDEERNEKYEFDYKMNKKTNFTIKNESNRGTIFGIKIRNKF